MAYKIKKAPHIEDQLEIQDKDETLTIDVDLYVDDVLGRIDDVRASLGSARKKVQELKRTEAGRQEISQAYQALSSATVALFELIFGSDQTQKIIEFYGGRTAAALGDLLPYVTGVILPAVKSAQEELSKRYTAWNL